MKLKTSPFTVTAAAKTWTEAKMEVDIIPLIAPYLTLHIFNSLFALQGLLCTSVKHTKNDLLLLWLEH